MLCIRLDFAIELILFLDKTLQNLKKNCVNPFLNSICFSTVLFYDNDRTKRLTMPSQFLTRCSSFIFCFILLFTRSFFTFFSSPLFAMIEKISFKFFLFSAFMRLFFLKKRRKTYNTVQFVSDAHKFHKSK